MSSDLRQLLGEMSYACRRGHEDLLQCTPECQYLYEDAPQPAMCHTGPAKVPCDAQAVVDPYASCLLCDLLSPHNGLHHDGVVGVYWREDVSRMRKVGNADS